MEVIVQMLLSMKVRVLRVRCPNVSVFFCVQVHKCFSVHIVFGCSSVWVFKMFGCSDVQGFKSSRVEASSVKVVRFSVFPMLIKFFKVYWW